MCNQIKSVTLQTAIFMQAKEFATNNSPFSVHDITRSIREKTAQGELEIPEVEVSGVSFRFDISHAKVKALFDELYRTSAFDADFTLTRNFNGMYFEYTPQLIGSVSTTPAPIPAPVGANVPVPTLIVPATTIASLPTGISATNSDRIKLYLTNCITRNFRPTLRKVQSAIKRNDAIPIPSCEELKDYITSLGYSIVEDPESISRAQVATV